MFEIVHKTDPINYTMPPHTHDNIEIYLCLTELPNVLLGSRMLPLSKDTLMVIPPNCIHKMVSTGKKYERYILTVNAVWFKELLGEAATEKYEHFFDPEHPRMTVLAREQRDHLIDRFKELMVTEDVFVRYGIFFDIMERVQKEVGADRRSYAATNLTAPAHPRAEV